MNDLLGWTLLSLQIAAVATAIAMAITIPVAYWFARRKGAWLTAIETLLMLPLVLPPTVVGYLLVVAIGFTNPLSWRLLGHSLLFTTASAVMAVIVVVLPLIYLPAKAAFAAVDPDLEDAARLAGAGRIQLFWLVSLPLARRGVAAGAIMAFARGLGEFGATVMVLGMHEDRATLPIAIYLDYTSGEGGAWSAIAVLMAVSLISVLIYSRVSK